MATLQTRWLLPILLVNLPNCFALSVSPGAPALPSPPKCHSPCDEEWECGVNIHCTWDSKQDPQIPTTYSLHWEPTNSEEGHVITGTNLHGLIYREHFTHHDKLRVWVQAKNQHGSVKSQEAEFNTEDIIKLPPPKVQWSPQEPVEISWNSTCDQLQLQIGNCNVRHRTEAEQVWAEEEDVFFGSYTFDSLQPCTYYEFQVRCTCGTGLMSDWSEIHRIHGKEMSPIGKLDVWRDCGIFPTGFDCILTWKRLSKSQACPLILVYEVTLSYSNGTAVLVNVSTAESKGRLVCHERQCQLNSSVKDASSVTVSAYNAHGASVPSYLAMPAPGIECPDCHRGKEKNEQLLHTDMTVQNLTVSWDLPSQPSDNLMEYVVQYKQAGSSPGQAFDWVKVNKSQTTAFFQGQFKKYTPYQVSLFTVSHDGEVHVLLSVITYSLQGTPSSVPLFEVSSTAATHVTLRWEPVPLCKQHGVIRYYQIGADEQNVYNVSVSAQHDDQTFRLPHLTPNQNYVAWIRAVTEAGPGEKATKDFKTNEPNEYIAYSATLPIIIIMTLVIICFLLVFCCCFSACQGKKQVCPMMHHCYCDKVPDPRNSHIFRESKHQSNDPVAWICIPIYEPHPKISLLEVVETHHRTSNSSLEKISDTDRLTMPLVGDESSQMDCQDEQREDAVADECHRTDHKYGRQAYSKMVDSDEEEDRGDCWNSSEEEQCTSGYEKHFMPTASEIMEVS